MLKNFIFWIFEENFTSHFVFTDRNLIIHSGLSCCFETLHKQEITHNTLLKNILIWENWEIFTSGEAKIGSIHKGRFVEQRLKVGDVYKISSGTTFYIVNTGEGQRLHIICSIDPSESVGFGPLQVSWNQFSELLMFLKTEFLSTTNATGIT